MAKHASTHKHEAPADVHAAVELVAELSADCCAKKDTLKPLQAEFEKANQAADEAEAKLRDAEEALLQAARQHKPEAKPEADKPAKPE